MAAAPNRIVGRTEVACQRIAADRASSVEMPQIIKPYWTARWKVPMKPGPEGIMAPKEAMARIIKVERKGREMLMADSMS